MRKYCILAAAFVAFAAVAAQAQDLNDCTRAPTPRDGIAGCTRLLKSGAIDANQRVLAFANRGLFYLQLKQPALALRDANQALALLPQELFAKFVRGTAHYMLGQRAAAIRDLRDALQIPDPTIREKAAEMLRNLGVAAADTGGQGQPGAGLINFTWSFFNGSGATVQLQIYAQDRRWPTADTAWTLNEQRIYELKIACRPGEKLCYGAWQQGNANRYWGQGYDQQRSCSNCCISCSSDGESESVFNLAPIRN